MISTKSCETVPDRAVGSFNPVILVLVVCVTCLFSVPSVAQHESLVGTFQEGNGFYEQKKYHEAIAEYEKILSDGYLSVALLYNLGNACYRIKAYGKAIYYYEKALRISPDDEDIRLNLEMANLRKVDQIELPPAIPLLSFFDNVKSFFPLPLLLTLLLVVYYASVGLIVIRLFRPEWVSRLRFRITRYVLTVLVVVLVPLSGARVYEDLTRVEAVILEKVVEVRSGPSDLETGLFLLHEGTKVEVKNQKGSWLEIRLPDGKVGWILENFAGIV